MSKNKNGNKTRTEKRLAVLVVLSTFIGLVMITSSSVSKAQTSSTAMTQYKDPSGRFTINYPATWTVTPATNRFNVIVVSFVNNQTGTNLNIGIPTPAMVGGVTDPKEVSDIGGSYSLRK